MVWYLLWFLFLAWIACKQRRAYAVTDVKQRSWRPFELLVFFALSAFIGLRHEVGGDWISYIRHIDLLHGVPFLEFWEYGDPAYEFLNWIGSNLFGDIYLVNTVCAILFCWGLFVFARSQPRPWLVLVVAFPYLILVVAMGYTRQGVAIAFLMIGLVSLMKGSMVRFVLWITIAAFFHKTVLIFIPLAIFSVSERPLLAAVGVVVTAALSFYLLLKETLDAFVSIYIEAEYGSSGAIFRVLLNSVPAFVYLMYRKRFFLEEKTHRFWLWTSVSAILFMPLLIISPSTTAVDRLALYWIPLQLFVLGRLPDVVGGYGRRNTLWVFLLVSYSFCILLFWLFFADHSSFWIPYRFYPLEDIF
jgi:EpsG family